MGLGAQAPLCRASCVFMGIGAARRDNKVLWSDELCFEGAANPRHRYSFRLELLLRSDEHLAAAAVGAAPSALSVRFCPRRGAKSYRSLEWPMRGAFALTVGEATATLAADEAAFGAFLADHAPPNPDNHASHAFEIQLTGAQLESVRHTTAGHLVVHVDLLQPRAAPDEDAAPPDKPRAPGLVPGLALPKDMSLNSVLKHFRGY
tara:strand:+ start:160 stop:774 length:615 start_codon:yes stop_codon:yes gene_type:complete